MPLGEDYASGVGALGKSYLAAALIRKQAQRAEKDMMMKLLTPIMVDVQKQRERMGTQVKISNINWQKQRESDELKRQTQLETARIGAAAREYAADQQFNAAKIRAEEAGKPETALRGGIEGLVGIKKTPEGFEVETIIPGVPEGVELSPSEKYALESTQERQKQINKNLSNLRDERKIAEKVIKDETQKPKDKKLAAKRIEEIDLEIPPLVADSLKNYEKGLLISSGKGLAYAAPTTPSGATPIAPFAEKRYTIVSTGAEMTPQEYKQRYFPDLSQQEFNRRWQIALEQGLVK